jgi:hypothetical protein
MGCWLPYTNKNGPLVVTRGRFIEQRRSLVGRRIVYDTRQVLATAAGRLGLAGRSSTAAGTAARATARVAAVAALQLAKELDDAADVLRLAAARLAAAGGSFAAGRGSSCTASGGSSFAAGRGSGGTGRSCTASRGSRSTSRSGATRGGRGFAAARSSRAAARTAAATGAEHPIQQGHGLGVLDVDQGEQAGNSQSKENASLHREGSCTGRNKVGT